MNIDDCWAGIDAEACYRYTLSRQTPRGGFSFYAYPEWGVAEPNAPDTYAAVAILALFGRPVPRMEDCAIWLAEQQDRSGGFPTLIIGVAVVKALRLLGMEPSWDPCSYLREQGERLWLGDASNRNRSGWLASARRCIALWQDYGLPTSEPTRDRIAVTLRHLWVENGGYGTPGASLSETARALALADAVGLPVEGGALAYARSCEGAPFGFNIVSSAVSSNIASQYAGIRVLRHFGSYPRYPLLVRNYIASCQISVGGFGRAPGAIARLDDTRRALAALSVLETPAQQPSRTV
jgi:hypothetical protein